MATTVLRASTPRDLLSYLPYSIGYVPRNSLVVACLRPGRGRVGLIARVDLPPLRRARLAEVAASMAGVAVRDGAERVVLVVYRDEPVPARAVAALCAAFTQRDLPVVDVFHVDANRYRCLTCDEACCPDGGRPLSELQSTVVSAEMVLQGASLVPDRAALVGDLSPYADEHTAAVAGAVRAAEGRWRLQPHGPDRARLEALELWRSALRRTPDTLGPGDLGVLLAALADLRFRDAVLVAAAGCGNAAVRSTLAGTADAAALDAAFGARARAGTGGAPAPADLGAVERLVRHLVRSASGTRRAGPLGVLAWLAWWRGQGALADQLVDRLLDVDPTHRLGVLLRAAVDVPVPPPWVRPGEDAPDGAEEGTQTAR